MKVECDHCNEYCAFYDLSPKDLILQNLEASWFKIDLLVEYWQFTNLEYFIFTSFKQICCLTGDESNEL